MKFTRFKILGVFILSLLLMLSIGCKKDNTPTTTKVLQETVTLRDDTIKEKDREIEELKKNHQEEMEAMKTALKNKHDLEMQGLQNQLNEAEKKLNESVGENRILKDRIDVLEAEKRVKDEHPDREKQKRYQERIVFCVLMFGLVLVCFVLGYKYMRQSELIRQKGEFIFENTHYYKELSNE